MRNYTPISLNVTGDNIRGMLINNLNAISASILSIITAVRGNTANIAANAVETDGLRIQSYTTVARPTSTTNATMIVINETTNKLNHTRDSGTTWYNADGTGA